MRLVDDWRSAWKWFSMWAMGVPATVIAAWLAIPEQWQTIILQNIPPKQLAWAFLGVLAVGIIGRLIQQESAKP